jgi:hypothetical protein
MSEEVAMYDPCGTLKLEGDEIIKRLAQTLNVTPLELHNALNILLTKIGSRHGSL